MSGSQRRAICAALCIAGLSTAAAAQVRPQYGSWGLDESGMDRTVRPGDDFFRYVNGAWLARTQIPPDKPGISLRLLMTDRTNDRLHDLMEDAKAAPATTLKGKVGAFYRAFMDEARANALGASPIHPELDAIRGVDTPRAVARLMGKATSDFYPGLFTVFTDVDLKDPKR